MRVGARSFSASKRSRTWDKAMPRRGRPCRVDCGLGTWVAHAAKNHKPLEAIVPLVKGLSICRSIETAHGHAALSVRPLPLPVYLGAKTSQNEGVVWSRFWRHWWQSCLERAVEFVDPDQRTFYIKKCQISYM